MLVLETHTWTPEPSRFEAGVRVIGVNNADFRVSRSSIGKRL